MKLCERTECGPGKRKTLRTAENVDVEQAYYIKLPRFLLIVPIIKFLSEAFRLYLSVFEEVGHNE